MSATVVAFVGAKGGTGTSTVCAETAKALHEKINVTVVDADLSGHRSAAVLFDALRQLDAAHDEQGHVAQARVKGVTLVELVNSYESAFTLSPEDVERGISSIFGGGLVLADVPLPFSATVRPLVKRATQIAVVTEPTLLGVTAARTMVAQLRHFGVPAERIGLVLNWRSEMVTASKTEVERAVGVPVLAELPPMEQRAFARNLSAFAARLADMPAQDPIEVLLPSDAGQVRNRRLSEARAGVHLNGNGHAKRASTELTPREELKAEIHEALAKSVDLLDAAHAQGDAAKMAELRTKISDVAQSILSRGTVIKDAESIAQIKEEIVNEALGLGPLEDFMHDPDITEVMVNGPGEIYIERNGIIYHTPKKFPNEQQLRLVIERIINPLGRRLDESIPMVDARLPDGSRVNAIIQPLSLIGPAVTIRRFGTKRLTADDLLNKQSVNPQLLDFLRACVEARLNIVISGGTGSGKTTFLNILSGYLPQRERIITIEDAAELHLNQPHVIPLEARPANLEGRGQISIRDLVRNALRMRPDRIVVGECRGPEALDMLQAMNTGHDGSLTTIHANSARDALARIETMVLMAGFDLPIRAIREQISSAIDLVIHTARMRDGGRKVTGVSEIVGMEGDTVTMQEIVRFAQHGVDEEKRVIGEFEYTGVQPKALRRFEEYGVTYDVRPLSGLALAKRSW